MKLNLYFFQVCKLYMAEYLVNVYSTWDIKLWCRFLQKRPSHFFLQKALVEFIMRMLSRKPLVKHKFIVVNLRLHKKSSHLLFATRIPMTFVQEF